MDMTVVEELRSQFSRVFGIDPASYYCAFAPGRVNIIGEHTDYSDGLVFPAGINMGTYILAVPNGKSHINCASINFDSTVYKVPIPPHPPHYKTGLIT